MSRILTAPLVWYSPHDRAHPRRRRLRRPLLPAHPAREPGRARLPSVEPGDTFAAWPDLRGRSGLVACADGRLCYAHPTVGLIWLGAGEPGIGPGAEAYPVRAVARVERTSDLELQVVQDLARALEAELRRRDPAHAAAG